MDDTVRDGEQFPPEAESETGGESKSTDGDSKEETKRTGNGFRDFVDGTAKIAVGVGSTLGETFKGLAGVFTGRNHVVMVRVNDDSLKRIDQLVEAGVFRSRSESAAYLIARGAVADAALFERLEAKVDEINRLRGELREMLGQDEEESPKEQGSEDS